MNRQFIEFQGRLVVTDTTNVTSKESWLIAYNSNKKDIVALSKMWTCVDELGCQYDNTHMQWLAGLTRPFTFEASS